MSLTPPNFCAIFQAAPASLLVLDPDFTIVAVSDAYLRATMTKRDEILGRNIFDVFPDNPGDALATGVSALRASLERVLSTRAEHAMALQKYDIRRPTSEGGGFEERYWNPINAPVLVEEGRVAYIVHKVEDVTDVVRLRNAGVAQDKEIQEIAARSEERYGQLLDAAPDAMVVVGDDGKIRLVNLQTETLFGYARSQLVGQSLDMLLPDRFRQGHAKHLARYFSDPGSRPMGSGLELFGKKQDGSEIPIEVSLSPLRTKDGLTVSAAIRDISDRKRMEASTKLLAARLASAVESIQDAFALFDNDDRLVLCNSVYRRLVGEAFQGPILGAPYVELLDAWIGDIAFSTEDERKRFRTDRLTQRRSEPTATFDLRMRDGRNLRVISRRTAEGGTVKTIWDLTDDFRIAEELRLARETAEAASSAKSEFLSSMSHELRTPLNAILGFAQLLERDKKEPLTVRHKERVSQILRGGEHLLRLIDDILDLSRIEAGGVSISTEPVGVSEVLEEVRSTLEPMAARTGIQIELSPLPSDFPMISADRTRFMQIVMNFCSNGIKYNRPSGKLTIAASRPREGAVRVTISDTGFGIPTEKQDKLFLPFQRAGQETGPIEGTGIGLVITKRLAELMHGQVGFRSAAGEGSEFWVELPLQSSESSEVASKLPRPRASERNLEGEDTLILYVEDNPANVSFMKDLLDTFDQVELVSAPTAEIGIEIARARKPKVIIMDINLPGMSGLDALRCLRETSETSEIPVIALTAAASERDKQRGEQAGFYRYLTKPVRVDEFVSALEGLLSPRAG